MIYIQYRVCFAAGPISVKTGCRTLVRDARMEAEATDKMESMTEEKGSQSQPTPQGEDTRLNKKCKTRQ